MRAYDALSKSVRELTPSQDSRYRIYSCGPTVYDHAHIGNLSAYIFADTLRRVLTRASGAAPLHVMNYTDVDDKTIRRSRERYPDLDAHAALRALCDHYIDLFHTDMEAVGNDTSALTFTRATDHIAGMVKLTKRLQDAGFAYVAEDGVYFDIAAYRAAGKTYGQLVRIDAASTGASRIQNDEYDKADAHDFALWKTAKPGEPSWSLTIDGQTLDGRPGWHIECSVMSKTTLGQPFDIHTGGIDLQFPHHENEIAQSTAIGDSPIMAHAFLHNDHILVDGRKMAKSAQNFYTLQDLTDKGYDALAFRVLVLQSHYRKPVNFSWESMDAATARLQSLRAWCDQRFQQTPDETGSAEAIAEIQSALEDDVATPQALSLCANFLDAHPVVSVSFAQALDNWFGLRLLQTEDVSNDAKEILTRRQAARDVKDFALSDALRDELSEMGIGVRDTSAGQRWFRL